MIAKATREAKNIINFFSANDLVNNADKACVVYNSKGKGELVTINNIGGENLTSLDEKETEKLLGLHVSREFNWKNHVDKMVVKLNQKVALIRRMRDRLPRRKLIMMAESIFNSKVRYGIALYLTPVYEKEQVKAKQLSTEARKLQVIQNGMLRMIFGYRQRDMVNMEKLRKSIGMFSINQMNIYHVLLEAFNIINHGSAEKIQEKWLTPNDSHYSNRRKQNVRIPKVNHTSCQGFSWNGAKLWNQLPESLKDVKNGEAFKVQMKKYIWETIPAY